MIKIALVDDHQMFRKGLRMILESFDNITVWFEAENGQDFFDKIQSEIPDIVMLDIQMPEMNGFETCRLISEKYPSIKILIVSQNDNKESIHKVIRCGAHGFFNKNSDPKEFIIAIQKLHENGFYFANNLGTVLADALLWERDKGIYYDLQVSFTPRELEIIKLAGRELNSSEIATKLFINVRTVETHRKRIMEKTDSKNFLGVVIYAIRNNYICIDEI